jgi:hypothetical protein
VLVSKYTTLNLIDIFTPRYKDRVVLIAGYKVKEHNKIIFTKAKHLADKVYYMSGSQIRSYPKDTNGKIMCYAVPLDDLEPLEYKEDVAKYAKELFNEK